MLGTTILVFSMTAFFVLFLIRSAHNIAEGKGATIVSGVAWVALFSGLYLIY